MIVLAPKSSKSTLVMATGSGENKDSHCSVQGITGTGMD